MKLEIQKRTEIDNDGSINIKYDIFEIQNEGDALNERRWYVKSFNTLDQLNNFIEVVKKNEFISKCEVLQTIEF